MRIWLCGGRSHRISWMARNHGHMFENRHCPLLEATAVSPKAEPNSAPFTTRPRIPWCGKKSLHFTHACLRLSPITCVMDFLKTWFREILQCHTISFVLVHDQILLLLIPGVGCFYRICAAFERSFTRTIVPLTTRPCD